jgi:hypothetical protein
LWELSNWLDIFLRLRPTVTCISYHSVMKLSQARTRFFSLWNYGTSVARTSDSSNTLWQSLWVLATEVLMYFNSYIIKWMNFLYPRCTGGGGGGDILFYLCPSFRRSKIFFIAFFSATIDGRNLLFGHKLHIGMSYCGKCLFGPVRFLLPVCWLSWFLYTLNIYAGIS